MQCRPMRWWFRPPRSRRCSSRSKSCSGCWARRPWRTRSSRRRSSTPGEKKLLVRNRRGRARVNDAEVTEPLRTIAAARPTYGYRRLWALLRRERLKRGQAPLNAKRVYRVVKAEKLLLQRYTGTPPVRAHEGKVAVERSDMRNSEDRGSDRAVCDEAGRSSSDRTIHSRILQPGPPALITRILVAERVCPQNATRLSTPVHEVRCVGTTSVRSSRGLIHEPLANLPRH